MSNYACYGCMLVHCSLPPLAEHIPARGSPLSLQDKKADEIENVSNLVSPLMEDQRSRTTAYKVSVAICGLPSLVVEHDKITPASNFVHGYFNKAR